MAITIRTTEKAERDLDQVPLLEALVEPGDQRSAEHRAEADGPHQESVKQRAPVQHVAAD